MLNHNGPRNPDGRGSQRQPRLANAAALTPRVRPGGRKPVINSSSILRVTRG